MTIRNKINDLRKALSLEIRLYPRTFFLLAAILLGAFFVRVYRAGDLLGFYYDQGRDALVVWRLWHEGKLFLVGPVTGLAGIFLGPLYYYLIAPFYLIGGGNPVVPAVFLALVATSATFMLYFLGWKFHSRASGIFAAAIGGFSYYIVLAGRWLSNPTSILLTSTLLLFSMWKVATKEDKRWWVAVALLIGISLQFQSASAIFFLPMILVFAIWQRKNLPSKRVFLVSLGVFFATLIPQIAFNFRHDSILFNNFKRVLIEEKSFRASFWEVFGARMDFFWGVFRSKIFPGWNGFAPPFFYLVASAVFLGRKRLFKNKSLQILLLFLAAPLLGITFFQGNYGNIYDYYLTGIYLPFILLFAVGLGELWATSSGKLAVTIFFGLFLAVNGTLLKNYLTAGVDGPTHITLGNQLQAVDWVFEDSKGRGGFNVDTYVPPVIPHAYDYLFLWQGTRRCGEGLCGMELNKQVSLVYTLYEQDPPHPERLEAWLERQAGIGEVEDEARFGGITVQRRKRL